MLKLKRATPSTGGTSRLGSTSARHLHTFWALTADANVGGVTAPRQRGSAPAIGSLRPSSKYCDFGRPADPRLTGAPICTGERLAQLQCILQVSSAFGGAYAPWRTPARPSSGAAMSALAELGIHLRHERDGKHRTACPKCAKPRDQALSVRIRGDWFTFRCFRCGWSGSSQGDVTEGAAADVKPQRPADPAPMLELWRNGRLIEPGTVAASYLEARACALPHPGGRPALAPGSAASQRLRRARAAGADDGCRHLRPAHPAPDLDQAGRQQGRCRPAAPLLEGADQCARRGAPLARRGGDPRPVASPRASRPALAAAAGFGLAWACLDAWHLRNLPVLPGIEALTIVADHDKRNPQTGIRTGNAAANACARRWAAAGVEVFLWTAPAEGQDFNDIREGGVMTMDPDEIREELAHGPNVTHFPGQRPRATKDPAAARDPSMADLAGNARAGAQLSRRRLGAEGQGRASSPAWAARARRRSACQLGAARAIAMPFLGLNVDSGMTLGALVRGRRGRCAPHACAARRVISAAAWPIFGISTISRPPATTMCSWPASAMAASCRRRSTSDGSNGSAT